MAKSDKTQDYHKAKKKPVNDPNELDFWWDRPFGERYHMYKVKVTHRKTEGDIERIKFTLAGDGNPPATQFDLDLRTQSDIAWPELPSTAQLAFDATPEKPKYAFLLLEDGWAERQGIDIASSGEGGGKYPISAGGLLAPAFKAAVDRLEGDPAVRKKLMSAFQAALETL